MELYIRNLQTKEVNHNLQLMKQTINLLLTNPIYLKESIVPASVPQAILFFVKSV